MFAGIVEVMFGGGLPARHLFEGNCGYVKKNRDLFGFLLSHYSGVFFYQESSFIMFMIFRLIPSLVSTGFVGLAIAR